MSKFEEKLSGLRVGTPIRFTQNNGQIIEGVIAENDGESMISLAITANITLRYSQIVSFESNNAFNITSIIHQQTSEETIAPPVENKEEETATILEPESKKEKKRNIKLPCSEFDIKKAFGAMESDARKAFNPAYGKIQSGMKSHDTSKFKEAAELIWKVMDERQYDEIFEVNNFYAYACMLSEEYRESAIAFSYANDFRNAFRAAYEGAEKKDDIELYALAAAFASIYITETEDGIFDEAVDALIYSSEKCMDVTGFAYVIESHPTTEVKTLLSDAFAYLAKKTHMQLSDESLLDKCISELKTVMTSHQVIEEILKSCPEEPSDEEDEEASDETSKENSIHDGKITKYNFFEKKGVIVNTEGKAFVYEVGDIADEKLRTMLLSISKWDPERTIPVRFKAIKRMGKDTAFAITRVYEAPKPVTKVNVNALFTQGKYEEALVLYKEMVENSQLDEAFSNVILCYIALWNKNGDFGYSDELAAFIEKYADKVTRNTKNLEALQQYYAKIQNYTKSLEMLNALLEICDSDNYGRILHYLVGKEKCYRILGDIPSAISQLNDWLQIVKRYQITDRHSMRDNSVYPELAELYFEIGDYDNAEKFAMLSASEERKNNVLRKIEAMRMPDDVEPDDETDDDSDSKDEIDETVPLMTLLEAYESYTDEDGLTKLGITDADVADKISVFGGNHLYCLLTWLKATANISKSDSTVQQSVLYSDFTMKQAIQLMESAFSYAFCSPLSQHEYTSTQIVTLYENAEKLIPQYKEGLMIASVLRTLFMPSTTQDYYMDDLLAIAEISDYSKKYPILLNLLTALKSFYDSTGCAIDAYAGYRSNADVIHGIIAEATELCASLEQKNDVFESQGQVRRLRELLFTDEQSELRKCLNIVVNNDVKKIESVRSCVQELFIRKDRTIAFENIDTLKIDDYIDLYWNVARDIILSEGRHISRPHDKIKGSKRTNVVNTVKKILSCICDWLDMAELSSSQTDTYVKQNYESVAPQIIEMLDALQSTASNDIESNGFHWGTEAIRFTARELLSKMNGTYRSKDRKYFFIDFLRGEHVLLNDKFLPELQSTFCGLGEMNILARIEQHAAQVLPSFEERIAEILSASETKHNFRSARLIREYAENVGNTSISDMKEFEQMDACFKQARKRFETMYQDFNSEISLYESYGTISDINGEKSNVLKLALDWFRITRITTDYGAYAMTIEGLKKHIAENAEERAQQLMRQLEELADKPEYDFGVYSKDIISGHINDHNFTSAEFILNCIRRHDTKDVLDYSVEPFGYFNEFVTEHQTNYRAVFGAGKNIVDTIAEYSGKKDMEQALIRLTNNARKETSGGAAMNKSWLPKGGPAKMENLQKLLTRLGFNLSTITPEDGTNIESYKVYCQKRCGKIIYPHTIPAFGSRTETEGFRVMCLYGKYDSNSLMDRFRAINSTPKHTLVLLDYALNFEDRRRLARKIKEEKTFSKAFIVVDRVILFYLAKHYAPDDTIIKRFMAVTLPFSYYQPFVEDSDKDMPPELFTGREDILTKIESPEGVNLVYGGRQLGKSALLKMAKRNIDKNGNNDRAILVDVQGKNYKDAALEVSRELVVQDILPDGCECDDWNVLVNAIKKRLMDENPETRINYLLIMLDEADEFIRTSAEDGNPPISATKNLPSDRFKLVMAGLHNLSRFNREMLQGNSNLIHLSHVIVRQFQRPEAIKLLTNTLAYLGFRFDEKVVSLILAKTNYYPGLIQFYCQKLLEAMKNEDYAGYSENNTPYYEVSESHIKKVLSDPDFMNMVNQKLEASLFTEEKGHSYYHIIALIFAFLYYDSSADKKYTFDDMMRVAYDYQITRLTSISSEKITELLNEMCDLNVLSMEDEFYRFATEGFRELLGSREKVEDTILDYSKEDIT